MTVYVVIQEGVYRHAIGGVYTTQAAAVARAVEMDDDYHNLAVYLFEVDAKGETFGDESKPVFSTKPQRWGPRS